VVVLGVGEDEAGGGAVLPAGGWQFGGVPVAGGWQVVGMVEPGG